MVCIRSMVLMLVAATEVSAQGPMVVEGCLDNCVCHCELNCCQKVRRAGESCVSRKVSAGVDCHNYCPGAASMWCTVSLEGNGTAAEPEIIQNTELNVDDLESVHEIVPVTNGLNVTAASTCYGPNPKVYSDAACENVWNGQGDGSAQDAASRCQGFRGCNAFNLDLNNNYLVLRACGSAALQHPDSDAGSEWVSYYCIWDSESHVESVEPTNALTEEHLVQEIVPVANGTDNGVCPYQVDCNYRCHCDSPSCCFDCTRPGETCVQYSEPKCSSGYTFCTPPAVVV